MREKLIDVFMHLDRHIQNRDEYGICYTSDFVEAIEVVMEMLKNGVTVQKWIPVKGRLPDIDGKYLVARKEGDRYSISVRKFRKEVPCWYTGYCGHWERRTNGITHWMHLPKPPKGE